MAASGQKELMSNPNHPLIYVASTAADADREIREEFLKHLRPVCKRQGVAIWCDQEITPGRERASEIVVHLEQAGLILFLVSPDFLADDEIGEQIINPALARYEADKVVIIPIRLIPASWRGVVFGKIEPLPRGEIAVTEMLDRDRAYADLVEKIVDVFLNRFGGNEIPAQGFSVGTSPSSLPKRALELATVASNEQALKLADALSSEVDHRLNELRENFRAGHHGEALRSIRELSGHRAWEALDPALRGKILRTRAIYEAQAGMDFDAVEVLIAQAAEIDPEGDDRSARAVLAYQRDDIEQALKITAQADSLVCFNVHLAFLLESQQIEAARRLLDERPTQVEPDAETKRLAAILALMVSDTRLARETIDEGLTLKPRWWSLQELSAVIHYWNTCVPTALLNNHPLIPRPFVSELVRYDDEARSMRRDMAARFDELALSTDDAMGKWRCRFWHFLCLLLDGEKTPDAEQALANLLDEQKNVPFILTWALAFDLDFDRDKVEQNLRTTDPARQDYLDSIGLLSSLLDHSGRAEEALVLLEKNRECFVDASAVSAWRRWFVSASLASGQQDEAEKVAREESDTKTLRSLLIMCADQRYRNSGDWHPLFEIFDEGYRETGDISMLLQACHLKGRSGEWNYVRENTDTLLNHTATAPVISLVSRAAWQCNDPTRCQDILDRYADRFTGKCLPEYLRRLRIACLRRRGLLNEAIESARENWERTRNWESLIVLLEAQVQQGDIAGAADSAQILLGFTEGNARQLLWVAEVLRIRPTYVDLARTLWRRAVDIGSEDADFSASAFLSGMALGFHEELRPLAMRFQENAASGTGSIWMASLDEVVSLIADDREQAKAVWEKYCRGEIGIHLLGKWRRAMAHFFHTTAANNREEQDIQQCSAILVRHGARPADVLGEAYRFSGRLIMDVTALLLANDLGILSEVEHHFSPIFVSPMLPTYLGHEIHELQPRQPDRIQAIADVDVLVRAGGIELIDIPTLDILPANEFEQSMGQEWLSMIDLLRPDGGALMEFHPLTSNDLKHKPVELPPDLLPFVTSLRAVLEQLLTDNIIDDTRHRKVLSLLGNSAASGAEWSAPQLGRRLLILPELAVSLKEAGLLSIITARYQVLISKREWEEVYRSELQTRHLDQLAAEWLDSLLNKVTGGLHNGIYKALPEGQRSDEEQEMSHLGLIRECGLGDLLHFIGDTTDLVWADDRWLSGYPNINATPLVGILEILRLLRSKGWASEAYYRALHKLRAGNYRYFPLMADEILHWLIKASVTNAQVQETPELGVLRWYWASILLDEKCLRINGVADDKPEITFISQSIGAISDVLTRIWQEPVGYTKRKARAQWLLDSLYVDLEHLVHLTTAPTPESRRARVALGLNVLLANGLQLDIRAIRHGREITSIQRQYMEWITGAFIAPRLATDPECAIATAELLCRNIVMLLDQFKKDGKEQKRAILAVAIRFVELLPETIREVIYRNIALMGRLGLKLGSVSNLGDFKFESNGFWQAVTRAMNHGESPLLDEKGRSFVMRVEDNGGNSAPVLLLECRKKKTPPFRIPDFVGVLSSRAEQRRKILNNHPEWRDGLDVDIDSFEQMLGNIESPSERIERLNEWQDRSAATFYVELENATQSQNGLTNKNFLPPPVSALLRYFRLEAGLADVDSFEVFWGNAAQRLLNDVGLEEALRRAVCLPVPLPAVLLEALKASQKADMHFEWLKHHATSPISVLHIVDLGLVLAEQVNGARDTIAKIIEHLPSVRYAKDFKLLQAILSLSRKSLAGRQDFRELPAMLKLALIWGHALTVQNRIQRHIELAEEASDLLENHAKSIPLSIFDDVANMERDVSNPAHVLVPHLVYHALGRILNRHPVNYRSNLSDLKDLSEELNAFVDGQPRDNLLIFLTVDTRLQTNALASLFGGDRETALEPFLGDKSAWFSSEMRKSAVIQLLEKLEMTPEDAGLWFALHLSVTNAEIYPDLKARCTVIAQNVRLAQLYGSSPAAALVATRMIFTWREDGSAAEEDLLRLMHDHFQSQIAYDEEDIQRFSEWIAECAYWLCRQEKCREDFDQRFTGVVERLLRKSNAFAEVLAPYVMSLSRQVSAVDYPGLQRLVLVIRSGIKPI